MIALANTHILSVELCPRLRRCRAFVKDWMVQTSRSSKVQNASHQLYDGVVQIEPYQTKIGWCGDRINSRLVIRLSLSPIIRLFREKKKVGTPCAPQGRRSLGRSKHEGLSNNSPPLATTLKASTLHLLDVSILDDDAPALRYWHIRPLIGRFQSWYLLTLHSPIWTLSSSFSTPSFSTPFTPKSFHPRPM